MSIVVMPDTAEAEEDERLLAEVSSAQKRERILILVTRIAIVVAVMGMWELAINMGLAKELLVGQPSRILMFLGEGIVGGELFGHALVTAEETLLGYTLGVICGAGNGLLMWWFPRTGKTIEPYYISLIAIPMVALAPLFMVWFGLGLSTKVALSFTTVFLVMHLNTYASLRESSKDLINLARIFGATRMQLFIKIVIPSSLPTILSTMKVCIGFALTGAVVGEFVAANKGLGYLTLYAAQLYEMSLVWAAIVVLVVISLGLFAVVSLLHKRFASWSTEA